MAVETFRTLKDMTPMILLESEIVLPIISDIKIVCTTENGKKSFRFGAAVLCNSFPDNFRIENSLVLINLKLYFLIGMERSANITYVNSCSTGHQGGCLF